MPAHNKRVLHQFQFESMNKTDQIINNNKIVLYARKTFLKIIINKCNSPSNESSSSKLLQPVSESSSFAGSPPSFDTEWSAFLIAVGDRSDDPAIEPSISVGVGQRFVVTTIGLPALFSAVPMWLVVVADFCFSSDCLERIFRSAAIDLFV